MDGKYEKTFIECNKWRSLIKRVVGRNVKVLSKTELDNVRLEYGEIVNSSEISTGDEINDVWNQSYDETGLKKRRKSNISFFTDDDIRLKVSRKSSNERKHNFPYHQRKLMWF